MESTIVYWGYIRIMENKMETTIVYQTNLLGASGRSGFTSQATKYGIFSG